MNITTQLDARVCAQIIGFTSEAEIANGYHCPLTLDNGANLSFSASISKLVSDDSDEDGYIAMSGKPRPLRDYDYEC